MELNFYCSRIPYVDHSLPIFKKLPKKYKGKFMIDKNIEDYVKTLGIDYMVGFEVSENPVMILSRADIPSIKKSRIVFLEHGVGTNYNNKSHLPDNKFIDLVLTTKAQEPAHRKLFGDKVKIVGCPKLDFLIKKHKKPKNKIPIVAFSHHWDQKQFPETRSAWPWDSDGLIELSKRKDIKLLGHKHPGDPRDIEGFCFDNKIDFESDWNNVIAKADLYICDNSSSIYEFAALDKPVVVLSPPFYRRNVNFGGRFWDNIPGIECSHNYMLSACVSEGLIDVEERKYQRHNAIMAAYGILGNSTDLAIEYIIDYLENPEKYKDIIPPIPTKNHKQFTLKFDVIMDGKLYGHGTKINYATALEMKEKGLIKGNGL